MESCRTRVEQLEKELSRARQERQKLQQQLRQPATGGVPLGGRLTQSDPQEEEEAEQQLREQFAQLQLEYPLISPIKPHSHSPELCLYTRISISLIIEVAVELCIFSC